MTEFRHPVEQSHILSPTDHEGDGRHRAPETNNELSDLERALLSINGDSYEGRVLSDEPLTEEAVAKSGLERFVKKFGLPEVASLIGAAGAAVLMHQHGGDAFLNSPTAIAAYIGETGAFYGTSLAQEWRKTYKEDKSLGLRKSFGKAALSDSLTYGAAEVVDVFTRNSALMIGLNIIPAAIPGGTATQAVFSKLVSDAPFYATANYFHKIQDDLKDEGVKPSVINVFGRTKQHAFSFMKRSRNQQAEPDIKS
jgi:hypothetical protein